MDERGKVNPPFLTLKYLKAKFGPLINHLMKASLLPLHFHNLFFNFIKFFDNFFHLNSSFFKNVLLQDLIPLGLSLAILKIDLTISLYILILDFLPSFVQFFPLSLKLCYTFKNNILYFYFISPEVIRKCYLKSISYLWIIFKIFP